MSTVEPLCGPRVSHECKVVFASLVVMLMLLWYMEGADVDICDEVRGDRKRQL